MEKYGVHQEPDVADDEILDPNARVKLADGAKGLCPQCGRKAVWHGMWHCANCGTAPWEVDTCPKPAR
jgi:hypothetical protein